jgi:hypothetical protein
METSPPTGEANGTHTVWNTLGVLVCETIAFWGPRRDGFGRTTPNLADAWRKSCGPVDPAAREDNETPWPRQRDHPGRHASLCRHRARDDDETPWPRQTPRQ